MTDWSNPSTAIETPGEVIDWLRINIASIVESTPLAVKMRDDDLTHIQTLDVGLTLSAADITKIEIQWPELVGKIIG